MTVGCRLGGKQYSALDHSFRVLGKLLIHHNHKDGCCLFHIFNLIVSIRGQRLFSFPSVVNDTKITFPFPNILPTKIGLQVLIFFHSDIFSSDKTAEHWKNARGNRDTTSFRQRFWRMSDRKKIEEKNDFQNRPFQ